MVVISINKLLHNKELYVVLLFLILPMLAFWRNFDFTGLNRTYFDAEFIGFYYPEFSLGVSLFGKWSHILWDPYNLMGVPLLGGVDRLGIFYPPKVIFYLVGLILDPQYRLYLITYFSVFHLTLAGIFMYIFASKTLKFSYLISIFVAILFAFNGSFIRFIALPNHMLSIVYLPLILYFLHKALSENKPYLSLLAGVFISPVLLSGYPPVFIYNSLFILLFLLLAFVKNKKDLFNVVLLLGISTITAFMIASPVLLPNLENASLSSRQKFNLIGSSATSFPPLSFIHYLFPGFFRADLGSTGIIWGYSGIITFVLALYSFVKAKSNYPVIFTLLLFFFFILSLGNVTFLHQFIYLVVPKYAFFRLPAMLHYLIGFCFACIAGYGLETFIKHIQTPTWIKIATYSIGGVFIISLFSLPVLKVLFISNSMIDEAASPILISTLFFFLSLFILWLIRSNPKNELYLILLIIVTVFDLFTVATKPGSVRSELDPRVFTGNNTLIEWIKEHTEKDGTRTFLHDLSLRYNSAELKVYQTGGYYGLYPDTYTKFFQAFPDDKVGFYPLDSKLYDVASVRYIATSHHINTDPLDNVEAVHEFVTKENNYYQFMDVTGTMIPTGTKIYVYENTNYLPKLKFYKNFVVVSTSTEAADKLANVIDISNQLVITDVDGGIGYEPRSGETLNSTIILEKYSNTEIVAKTKTEENGMLYLSDSYYPGWKAYIDGNETEIFNANVAFRAIALPKGEHEVKFYYVPKRLYLGLFIGGITLLILIYLIRKKTLFFIRFSVSKRV